MADLNITLSNVAPKDVADAHYADTANPHGVTKAQVGLSDVDNTSDADKPISTLAQAALDLKQSISGLFTAVMALVLTGFTSGANTAIAATDTLAQALAKIQGQINARATTSALTSHASDTANPHSVTKTQVGLGNVDDTADMAKPVSTAQQTALDLKLNKASVPCEFIVACSDMTTAITAATDKAYFDAPYAFTLTEVIGTLFTVQASGSTFTVDIHKNGTTVLSTKITIENTEDSSLDATTQPVISVSSFAKGDRLTFDVDQIGNGTAKGLQVTIIGTHSV